MDIRQATSEDIPAIARIAQEIYKATFTDLSEEEMTAALKTRDESYFGTAITTDTILVAVEDAKVVGFIQLSAVSYDSIDATDKDRELNKIYIDQNYQGKGIGKALMSTMLEHARITNIENIYLDVYDKNKKAIGLYEKYGFKRIGTTPFKLEGKIVGYDLLMKSSVK